MTRRVGIFGAERRTERIGFAERLREGLRVELAADRQARLFLEEILRIIDRSVLVHRNVLLIQGRHLEHLPGSLRIVAGNQRRMDVDESALLEEAVNRVRRQRADAEDRLKGIGARTQMRNRAEIFHGMTLLLERIIRCGRALDDDALRLNLKGLLRLRRRHQRSGDNHRRARSEGGDFGEVLQLVAVDHLQRFKKCSVMQHNKSDVLGIADAADPSPDLHRFPDELIAVAVYFSYCRQMFHKSMFLPASCMSASSVAAYQPFFL